MQDSRPSDPVPEAPPPGAAPPPSGARARHLAASIAAVRALNARNYLWIGGFVVVLAAALHWLGGVLTPFLIGAILAYLGRPIVARCERLGLRRSVATLVAMLLLLTAVTALFVVVVPLVNAQALALMHKLPELAEAITARLAPWAEQQLGITLQWDAATLKQIASDNMDSARDLGLRLLAGVRTGGLLLIGVLVNMALIPVVMFYLLRDWHLIVDRIDDLVPRRWLVLVRGMAHEIDHVLAEFLHGQLLVMLSLATFYAVGLSLAGLRYALPIGVLTGVLVFIPYVGFGLGFVLGMLAAVLQWTGWPAFVGVLVVYGIGQLLESYVLVPWLVGDRIGLHPLVVIFALLAFGQLFGFAGVLLALPASAAILVGLRRLRAAYVESPLYRDP